MMISVIYLYFKNAAMLNIIYHLDGNDLEMSGINILSIKPIRGNLNLLDTFFSAPDSSYLLNSIEVCDPVHILNMV